MWYCAMLFWCFIISWVLLRINNNVLQWVLFLISAVLVFAYPNFWYIPFQLPLGIDNGLYYYSYFALGGCIFMFKDKYKDIFDVNVKMTKWIISNIDRISVM